MKSTFESALAVGQMLVSNLLHARRGQALSQELLLEQAKAAITALQATEVDPELLAAELAKRFDIFVRPASILLDTEPHEQWVTSALKPNWRFWRRCEQYLLTRLPEPVVRGIDEETDRILGLLGNPVTKGPWDRRGLVVGDVQFGKTSNYSALACKAADAGYKVIIVLAGMHESLRMQTQIRLDEAFLGFKTDQSQALTGAGLYDPSLQAVAATARSLRGDFNKIVAGQLSVPLDIGPPILLVVKKNAKMLRNLHSWLERVARSTDTSGRHVIRDAPALVIDDESDNASVDTAEQTFDKDEKPDLQHQPTAINTLIRQILKTFDKRSYVGYTATPFANIFIHRASETTDADKDLFPKHFIVNLHAPSNYFGPVQAFGSDDVSEDASTTASALVRVIDRDPEDRKELDEWMPMPHKQHHEPLLSSEDGFPHSLRRAVLSFIIACAVRKLRGQATEHNSMLVHVTRYTKVQAKVFDQISESLVKIRRRLRFGDQGATLTVLAELRALWSNDFVPTTKQLRDAEFADAGELPDWADIEAILPDVAAGIKVKQINGQASDVLDYDSHSETGIDVIVVGGDKLSRGLTLYGLTVSYFTRQTDMYDTLLQMGRWFGYRSGYLDLCRLYTTGALNSAFEHIAFASDELRREFDYMQTISKTPEDFGLKVLAHPVLKVTAANKRRHARDIVLYASYAGIVSETKSFSLEPDILSSNRLTLDRFVSSLRKEHRDERGPSYLEGGTRRYSHDWLWRSVPFEEVGEFLRNYHTEPSARRASSKLWIKYIEKQIAQNGELKIWNVALFDGDAAPFYNIGGLEVRPTRRQRDKDIASQLEGYHTKRLVTTRDVGIDMPLEPWKWALDYDRKIAPDRTSNEPSSSALCLARKQFNVAPLLMLYLPQPNDYPEGLDPVVGAAIAFPGSDKAASIRIRYTVNSVYDDDELDEVA